MYQIFKTIIIAIFILLGNETFAQCSAPINLAYSYANATSTWTWDAVPGAISYEIEFKDHDPFYTWASPIYVTTSATNSLSIQAVQNSASYDWRVRAICSSTSTSGFTEGTFTVPCPAATNPITISTTNTTADVSWQLEPGAVYPPTFAMSYRILGSGGAWIQAGGVTGSSFTFVGLQSNTTYEWCVVQGCGYFNSTPVIGQFTTTGITCPYPSVGSTSNVTQTSATINWVSVANASSYILIYKALTSGQYSSPIIVTGNSYTFNNLLPNTQYSYRISTNCNGSISGQGTFNSFNTLAPGCVSAPANITVNAINSSATIAWDMVSNANYYEVKYRKQGTSIWLSIYPISTANSMVNNLTMNTTYEFQVNAICSGGNISGSPIATFTTANCMATGVNTNDWIDFVKIGTIIRTSGAEAGGYVNTGLSTGLVKGVSNACQFSAGFSGNGTRSYAVFIDYNNDGSFTGGNEKVFGWGSTSAQNTKNFSFTVPNTIANGTYAMRVMMFKYGSGNGFPCQTGFLGETEDYIVNISGSSNRMAKPTDIVLASVNPNPSTGIFKINFDENNLPMKYVVKDLYGRIVKNISNIESAIIEIDLSNLANGIYVLGVVDLENNLQQYKLLKE